ncbi:RlpA-like double-psi beta-barrel-protein domain-containing protein-containing protein [Russula vinacea]|nr:RlpA-like double-psi beta-barrel-protein domain-containing protein-containing protein [Russula vinacea]
MKTALAFVLVFLSSLSLASDHIVHHHGTTKAKAKTKTKVNTSERSNRGWVQNLEGTASFTAYSGCQYPSCGIRMTEGYTAAVNVLSFGAMESAGDACGRCFEIAPTKDPYSPDYTGRMGTPIIVRVTDLCPFSSGDTPQWCDQTVSTPVNQYGKHMHFDLCEDSGAPQAFFEGSRGAMLGNYKEVSCSRWRGIEGERLWNGACMGNSTTPFWPERGCGNVGTKHSLACAVIQFGLMYTLRICALLMVDAA